MTFVAKRKMLSKKEEKIQDWSFIVTPWFSGLDGIKTITDISLGGIFLEVGELDKIEIGQPVMINVKLPTEPKTMRLKAKVVNKTHRGIGCQFKSLEESQKEAICLCFEYFKDTLPAKCK